MPTPTKKFKNRKALGICPKCFGQVRYYVVLNGLFQWDTVERCGCLYINDKVEWPFEEDATFEAVKPAEFLQHGILIYTGQQKLRPDVEQMYEELYADQYEEEQEAYLDEVDHGWERSHH